MKNVNFKERKKAVQIVSKRSAVIAHWCRFASGNIVKVEVKGLEDFQGWNGEPGLV